ncbi:MAG TPA: hypothetical protein VJT31_02575 [Rugosimonospora sp.]|nr:hypothetical protein [Rugosimonospora sp.]
MTAESATPAPSPVTTRRRLPVPVDAAAILACLAAVPVVHAIGPVLREPYVLDEAWTGLSAKAPLSQLTWLTASTPLGWTLLLRLFPVGGEAQRLLPLVFLAGSVAAAYAFGRLLGWSGRGQAVLAGLTAAAAAVLLPAQQLRHDLKQYTADAAIAVALFALVAWAETRWSRRRGVVLLLAISAGSLVSHTAILTGAAAIGGLASVALLRRAWRQVLDIAVLGALTGAVLAVVYQAVDKAGRTGDLYQFWAGFFPGIHALPGYLALRLGRLQPVLGMPWPLFLALAAVGLVVVARTGRPATAVAVALLPPGLVVAGVARLYPLLDLRTSHFCYVTLAVVGAVGVTDLARLAGRLTRPHARIWVGAALSLVAIGGYAAANAAWLRYPVVNYDWVNEVGPTPPPGLTGDVPAQVRYIASHRRPGDVILIHGPDEYAFAYYWSVDRPTFVRGGSGAIGWSVTYPAADRIVIAGERDPAATRAALTRALALTGSGGQVWLVRSHVAPSDIQAWASAVAALHVRAARIGIDQLELIDTPSP